MTQSFLRQVFLFSLIALGFSMTVSADEPTSGIKAAAFANQTAVTPGQRIDLVIRLEIPDNVHIYWRNPGGPGLPTSIEWTGPTGVTFGRTQFPPPMSKYDENLKTTSYIHEGTAFFLTPVMVTEKVKPGSELSLKAKISWLACSDKGKCVPGGTEVEVKIPVVEDAASVEQANQDICEEAQWTLPTDPAKAEHAKISTRTSVKEAEPGASFTATLIADIAKHHHMQSHEPLEEYLVAAILFLEPTDGFKLGDIDYPKPQIRNDKMLGKLSEYAGKVDFNIPVTVKEKGEDGKPLSKAPRFIRGVLQYQICNDEGTCFPPQYVSFAIPVQMKGGPVPDLTMADLGAGVDTSAVGDGSQTGEDKPSIVAEAAGDSDKPAADPSKADANNALAASLEDAGWLARAQNWLTSFGYVGVLIMAFIGGLILNLMPCVLPVLSLKVLSFVKQAKENRGRILALGLSYCSGILVFFGVLAFLYFKSGQGWGQLFQNPIIILILAAIVGAFALSLFGVFAVFTPRIINELGQKAEDREGLPSAFFTGVLATFLGTACTAPFLSAAIGAASKFPPFQGALIFMAVGIGMMFPFLVLSANPKWLRFVPKPGKWMVAFEAVMGFLLLGTVVWLLNPIPAQLGSTGLILALAFILCVCFAAWIRGKAQFSATAKRKYVLSGISLAIIAIGWFVPFQWMFTIEGLREKQKLRDEFFKKGVVAEIWAGAKDGKLQWPLPNYPENDIFWVPYDQELIDAFVNSGYAVFVDFTAEWCVNCKLNENASIDINSTNRLLKKNRVVTFKADYTNREWALTKVLRKFGHDGVPMYLMYEPFDTETPKILPELLSPGIMADALVQAGPSRPEDEPGLESASAQR